MSSARVAVKAAFDPEAGVWFVEWSDLFGLNAEGTTIEELQNKLPGMIADLINDDDLVEVFIDLSAHASTRTSLAA